MLPATVFAADVYVQPEKLDVREGPGLLFDPVDSVTRNTKLSVLEKTDDGWIKVQTPAGKQGYVFSNSVADKQISTGASDFLSGLVGTSDADASKIGTAAAAKGLEPESTTYAKNKNYSTASLDQVTALNKSVKGKEWMQFCQDGKVGPAKPKNIVTDRP
jgi:uncharacterized protein YgiM (DUF1202 family)